MNSSCAIFEEHYMHFLLVGMQTIWRESLECCLEILDTHETMSHVLIWDLKWYIQTWDSHWFFTCWVLLLWGTELHVFCVSHFCACMCIVIVELWLLLFLTIILSLTLFGIFEWVLFVVKTKIVKIRLPIVI